MKKTVLLLFILFLFGSQIHLFSAIDGDANGDNSVNITDALLVSQFYVGILLPGNIDEICSDVNCSNIVDIVDALLIARYYVKLISQFPCNRTPVPATPEPTTEPTPEPIIVVELGIPFRLQYGHSARFDGENLLKFQDVISDSRCPTDIVCVWEGEVEVQLEYINSEGNATRFSLSSVNNMDEQVGNYLFVMDNAVLPPQGRSDTTIDKEDYVITLTIFRLITIRHISGYQCQPAFYQTQEEARVFLEANGIKVYSMATITSVVCAACDVCPSGIEYVALISSADLELAIELGW